MRSGESAPLEHFQEVKMMYTAKRALDLAGSIILLLLLFVPMLLIALVSLCAQGRPVFLRQARYGKDGKVFTILKFRTMRNGTPNVASNRVDAGQITKWGEFLRRTSLDELPQLWNILKGDMSFVGPRPLIVEEKDAHRMRTEHGVYRVRPGITGWAQVNGRDFVGLKKKTQLDVEYIEKASFLFDLKIVWRSVGSVFMQKDIRH